MCGIIGRINYKSKVETDLFTAMRDTLTHRGPDGAGLYMSPDGQTALGHRRLSFLDLTPSGTQPLANEDKSILLTINGEIYNYKELRILLQQKGHVFSSDTDSEVVLHGYEEWGTDVLLHLSGMFAFGIWNNNTRTLFLARDRFGIKPLYYYKSPETFVFASELKAIVRDPDIPRHIDYASFAAFFTYRYVPSPATIWKDMYKLPPAHYMLVQDNIPQTPVEYWQLVEGDTICPDATAIEKTNTLLYDAVQTHIQSEVPVGSFLSGGYDSSALVYYLHRAGYPARAYTIGFDNWAQSEHKYASIVADTFNTPLQTEIIGSSSLKLLDTLSSVYDEPIADISIIPTYVVSRLAASGVKAVLSGEGADEIFCGYTWHKEIRQAALKRPFMQKIKEAFKPQASHPVVNAYSRAMAMGLFDTAELRHLLCNDLHPFIPQDPFYFYASHHKPALPLIKQLQYLDIKTFMGELVLTKVDRASMAHALEVRVPFLDHRLVEYLFGLHPEVYFRKDYKKFLLYENIREHLPDSILQRSKQGFVGPDSYYQNTAFYRDTLAESTLAQANLIKQSYINTLLANNDHWRLWKVLVMELWYKRWM